MPTLSDTILPQQCRWHSFATAAALEVAATQAILHAAQLAIAERGAFRLVLAGGTTPRRVYESLCKAEADWTAWHIYFGDERCLPPEHAERNSHMARLAWLGQIAIPPAQVHAIPAEIGAESAASSYARILQEIGMFDLVLLGLGEDGHTASLFPGHEWGVRADAPAALAVHDAPKPPPERVSLSAQRLSASRLVLFLVTGAAKQQAIKEWRGGLYIPAAAIAPEAGVDIYLEAGLLEETKPSGFGLCA